MLFGTSSLKIIEHGVEADEWLPIIGNVDALDDVERLKQILDYSLLRVFEGLGVAVAKGRQQFGNVRRPSRPPHDDDYDSEREEGDVEAVDLNDPTLSETEVRDLDRLTTNVVRILNE